MTAFDIGSSGIDAAQTWLDLTANNIANADSVRPGDQGPFRAMHPIFSEKKDPNGEPAGVEITGVMADGGGALVYDPNNPAADSRGLVALAAVDMSTEMTNMMIAQRAFQLNIQTVQAARERYEASLQIGK